jgi:hypothetical protein
LTDANAARLAALIARHKARGCYCPRCAEAMADLYMDSRDLTGCRLEGASK